MWPTSQYSHTNTHSQNNIKTNEHQNQQNLKTLGMTSAISTAGMFYNYTNIVSKII